MSTFAAFLREPSAQGGLSGIRELLLSLLSPIQRKFVLDKNRKKLARCSRRAGKTYAVAVYMILECLEQKNIPVLYAGLTRDSAKEAVWDTLVQILEALQIPHKVSLSTLQIIFENGSKITIFGCDQQNARNRLRGRKFKLICFDETGFYTALDPLVTAVLPMLADFGGTLCLASSPGELLQGLFYEADQNPNTEWSRYHWTIHDSPLFQKPALDPKYKTRAEEELDIVLRGQYNGNAKAAGYRREWLGLWVNDDQSLVYPCTELNFRNPYGFRAQEHALGISMGPWTNAIVVGRFSEYSRDFQIVGSKLIEDSSLDHFAECIKAAQQAWKTETIMAHTGPYTKEVVPELRKRYQLPINAVDMKDLGFHQKVFATDLRAGHIHMSKSLSIVDEYGKIVKDKDGEEIDGQPNYQANAALALYKRVYQTHLRSYEPPLTAEELHIKQLEESRDVESHWSERII